MTDDTEKEAQSRLERPLKEHVGLPVAGYQPQSDHAVCMVNSFKEAEERILRMLDQMEDANATMKKAGGTPLYDGRWLAIGRTQLEQAFMAINRSVFKPSRLDALPEDGKAG